MTWRTWSAARRKAVSSGTVFALAAGIVTAAFVTDGQAQAEVALNDSGVWVTNDAAGLVGRFNTQSQALDSTLVAAATEFDVQQHSARVLVTNDADSAASPVDPAHVELGTPLRAPQGAQIVSGGATAAVLDAARGRLWVLPFDAVGSFDEEKTKPTVKAKGLEAVTVSQDGTVFAVAPRTGTLYRVPTSAQGLPEDPEHDDVAVEAGADVQVTTVGDDPVVLDRTAGRLVLPGGDDVELADPQEARLQQPSGESDHVLVATAKGLVSQPLRGGAAVTRRYSGIPAAPVQLGGCDYAAWSGSGQVLRDCEGTDADFDAVLDGLGSEARLEYRVNRDAIVLNDLAAGILWMAQQDFTKVDDWEQTIPEDAEGEEQDSEETTPEQVDQPVADRSKPNRAPVAAADGLGARPGRTTVLDVLGNDVDPDGDVITAEVIDAPKVDGVQVQRILGGAALQIVVAPGTTAGEARFTYRVSDGRGGSDDASVRVSFSPEGQNAAPVQTGAPVLKVARGATASIKVLPYFGDPDGDELLLVSADSTVNGDQVRSRPDGTVEIRDGGTATGRKVVTLAVADGLGLVTEGTLNIDVVAGQSPPIAVNDHVQALAGEPITVRPLSNDSDPDGDALRLAGVTGAAPAVVTANTTAGTFSFVSPQPGSYDITYQVSDGPSATMGLVRVDVAAPSDGQGAPVVVGDEALLPTGGSTLVDVLANDTDPAGGVLVVQSVDVPADAGVTVAVLAHHVLRITELRRHDQPVTVRYTASNGAGTAVGEVRVVPVPAPAKLQPPDAQPDDVTVHTGDIVTIHVLANDTHPDGLPLEVTDELVEQPEPTLGEGFVSGDTVRFKAGSQAGTAHAVYQVRDPNGQKDSAQVTIHVSDTEENTPPTPPDVDARVLAGAAVIVDVPLDGVDPDGDSVTLTGVVSAPSKGTARLVDGRLEFQAAPTAAGLDTFRYSVTDARGAVAVGTVRVGIAKKPDENHAPVTTDDAVTVRPERTVAIPALENDSDPDGDTIGLFEEGLEGADELEGAIAGDQVVVTSPGEDGTVSFYYGVQDPFGARASGSVTLTTSADAPLLSPVAQDDVVTLEQAYGHPSVAVDVRANDSDPDGTADVLEVSADADGVRVDDKGRLVVPVTPRRQIITYTVTDQDGLAARAFVHVPAVASAQASRPLPTLRSTAPLEVVAGQPLDLDLGRLVLVADGRTPRLTEEGSVRAIEGHAVVTGPQGLTYTSDTGYAGPAAVTFEVTDGTGPDDPDGLKAVLTQPITVAPAKNQPPALTSGSLQVAAGEEAVLNLGRLATDPDGDALAFTAKAAGEGLSVSVEGDTLKVQTDPGVPKGTAVPVTITVSDGKNPPVEGLVQAEVVASTRQLVAAAPDTVPDAHQGKQVSVDVLANDSNPFPGKPLTLVDAVIETGRGIPPTVSGGKVNVTPDADFVGVLVVRYRVGDATGDPDREVEGRLQVTVLGRPEAPAKPAIEEIRSQTVVLSWEPPADNGSPITGYTVTSDNGYSKECATTTCTLDGLTNDVKYHFSVVATNAVDSSDPSPLSDEARPDERPDPPAAPTLKFGDQSLTITWTNKAYTDRSQITCVNLEISPAPASGAMQMPCVAGGSTTWTGLANGTAYKVRLQARNGADEPSDWGEYSAEETPAGVPGAPGQPTATNSDTVIGGQVTVEWAASAPNGDAIATYHLQVLSGGAAVKTVDVPGGATSTTVSGLDKTASYTFAVTATNKAGESVVSAQSAPVVPSGTPDAPGQPSASRTGAGAIHVEWSAPGSFNGGGASYNVIRNGAQVATGLTGTTYDTSGLDPTQSYSFQVVACNAQRCGPASVSSAAVTPYTTPGAPGVEWSRTGTNGGYFLVRKPASNGGDAITKVEWEQQGTNSGSGTVSDPSWPVRKDVAAGYDRTYKLRARACNAAGCGAWSDWVTGTTAPTPPPPDPQAWVTHGSSAQGQPGCSSSGCYYYRLNWKDFPSGNHFVECWAGSNPDTSGWHNIVGSGSGNNRSFGGSGNAQLTCYYGYLQTEVAVRIDGKLYEARVW